MNWRDDVERDLSLLADNLSGPGMLYGLERLFWLDLWRVPVLDDDDGLEDDHDFELEV